jgi:YVTN family beta-propeller protein
MRMPFTPARSWYVVVGALALVVGVALAFLWSSGNTAILEPPGRDSRAHIEGDTAILVNGRRVTPAGRVLRTQSYAWGLALSPDGSRAAVLNKDAFELVDLREPFAVRRVPALGAPMRPELGTGSYMGCAFSPDGRTFYYGSVNEGRIIALDVATAAVVGAIDLDADGFEDSFPGDLVLSGDGRRLFVVDQFNYRLVTIDVASRAVIQSVRVGRNPFAVALSADERYAWVSNVGMFEYPLVPGVTRETRETAGLSFPVYGIPSQEAENGVDVNGVRVPGLGSPNHPDAMSVFRVDLAAGRVTTRIKTGYLVGVPRNDITTVGGASPGALVVGRTRVWVANATNDTISVIDAASGAVVNEVELTVQGLERLRGVLPFGMALTQDESRLYVACAGLNAVAVIDVAAQRLDGYIPAGWFPSMVALGADDRTLVVSSAKGLGSGPNGGRGFVDPPRGATAGDVMQGTLQIVPAPDPMLARHTKQVVANTYRKGTPRAQRLSPASSIKHVVFIVKENRTFDQVYGRPGTNGDPTIADLGTEKAIRSRDGSRGIEGVDVSPNHQALADRFAIFDNFYCESDQSNTGHRWVVGVYPTEWVEVNARSRIESRLFSSAPGRRYVAGTSATVLPEDDNEAGALWEHLTRQHVSFYNFGFGTEMPASIEAQMFKETGIRMSVSFPLPKPLFDRTSRVFPTFNMAIPDQYRVDMFEQELRERWESGREAFPQLVTMVLTQDHLTEEHPADGYPFRESYMADNDLALGRVMQTLSRSRWWPEMLVIIAEDDPQGGRDHVDAHRSILLLAGPQVRRGYVSRTLASFGSIMRLIFLTLGVPALNQFDATASLPLDVFADAPDATPYVAKPVDRRLFDPDAALKPFDRAFNVKGLAASQAMDDPDDMRRQLPAAADIASADRGAGLSGPRSRQP